MARQTGAADNALTTYVMAVKGELHASYDEQITDLMTDLMHLLAESEGFERQDAIVAWAAAHNHFDAEHEES